MEYVKKAPQGETTQGQSEEQAQKQEENVIQPVEVTQSTQQEKNEPQTSHSEQKVKRNEHNEEKRALEPQQTELSAKKSQKEQEAPQRPVGQQTPQKNKPHAEIPTEAHQLKTPERPQETIKSQETNQTSGVKR